MQFRRGKEGQNLFGHFGEGGSYLHQSKRASSGSARFDFLKGQIFPVEWRKKGKIKALFNWREGVGKCLHASGNTKPSEGAQWQDHKYPSFDHSDTHAQTHAINQTNIFLSVPADLFVSDTDFSMTTCNSFPLLQNADGPF